MNKPQNPEGADSSAQIKQISHLQTAVFLVGIIVSKMQFLQACFDTIMRLCEIIIIVYYMNIGGILRVSTSVNI